MQTLTTNYRQYVNDQKIQILFMFQAGTVWSSLDSVYRCCLKDQRFEVRLALIEETTVETSHMKGAREFLEKNHFNYCEYESLDFKTYCPHVVFIQFPYDAATHTPDTLSIQFRYRGTRVVYVPYGIEISDTELSKKDHFNSFVVENAWRIYTSCDGIKKEYDKYCRNREAVRVCGSPKFDAICNKDKMPVKGEITERIKNRKLVVWKIHFPKKVRENEKLYQITPYVREYIDFALKIDKYQNLFFVVLAHPKMLKGVVTSDVQGDDTLMQQIEKLLAVLSEKENVYIDTDDDYRPSLYHADAIVIDRSAVMIEAAMLSVPVLLMKNSDYSEPMVAAVENVVRNFYQGSYCKDIEDFLDAFVQGENMQIHELEAAVKENFPLCDGACGQRIVDDIANGLCEAGHDIKVILYGTGTICSYYMEKQRWGTDARFTVVSVVDSDSKKWGSDYYGIQVEAPNQIINLEFDAIVIMTEPYYFEIKKKLVYEYYLDERKIWRLDDFVVELQNLK